jgi:uncharacterized membrane protein YjjP (DUF1212 family)
MGTGAFAPAQSRLRDCALISDSIASVLGVTVRRSPWLVFARWLVSCGFLALLFSCDTHFFCLPSLLRHIATRRRHLFPRRLAAFLFLVVTITITTIIIVINMIITGPKIASQQRREVDLVRRS